MRRSALFVFFAGLLAALGSPTSQAQATPFVGQILIVPYNFAPRGFAMCNGQLLSISANTALFSLLGTTYGGDGRSTFALPDLQGRVPIGMGQGPGAFALRPRTDGRRGVCYAHAKSNTVALPRSDGRSFTRKFGLAVRRLLVHAARSALQQHGA